jgi:hypothetical protein
MRWSIALALAVLAAAAESHTAMAQPAPAQCNTFIQIKTEAQEKALAVRNAMQHKADRKELCTLTTRFYTAESMVVKFLVDNQTWCGVPPEAIQGAKASHENTAKFRTAVCAEAPVAKPHVPTLSDAIGTPSVDTAGNTKTGRGTLDSLNGNPLAK